MLEEFHFSTQTLHTLTDEFSAAMVNGLKGKRNESLKLPMLPTYISTDSLNPKDGIYLGVDLGGTNFRISLVCFEDGIWNWIKEPLSIPIPVEIKNGSGHLLFEFIAIKIKHYMGTREEDENVGNWKNKIPMGFTFSYPTKQTNINEGFLIEWAKDIKCNDVVGLEIVQLLQQKLNLIDCPVTVEALINDTVAAMMAYKLTIPNITVSSVFGTGTNGAYIEDTSEIELLASFSNTKHIIINTEWGSFWSNEITITKYDKKVDLKSLYPGRQRFEKLISARYLPSIIEEYLKEKNFQLLNYIEVPITMELVGRVIDDEDVIDPSIELHLVEEVRLFRELCIRVVERAGKLGAVPIVCCLQKTMASGGNVGCVCIDGSLYEKNCLFKQVLQETVELLIGKKVNFYNGIVEECSCFGAIVTVACK